LDLEKESVMRIVFVDMAMVDTSPAGSQMLALARALCEQHKVTVFTNKLASDLVGRVEWVYVPIVLRRPILVAFLAFRFMVTLLYLWRGLKGERYDIVHITDNTCGFGDVCTVHGSLPLRAHTSFRSFGIRWLIESFKANIYRPLLSKIGLFFLNRQMHNPKICAFVAISHSQWESFRKFHRGLRNADVIYNYVNIERFRPSFEKRLAVRKELSIPEDTVVCMTAALGNWESKGLPIAIEAIARLPSTVHLIVVGPLTSAYEQQAKNLGVSGRVHFVGFTSEIERYYSAADIFVLPSRNEALPLVVIQALATGLPVILSDFASAKEVCVDGETGFIVKRDVDAIVEKMRLLSKDSELRKRMGKNAMRFAKDTFSLDTMVGKYLKVYERVVEAKRKRAGKGEKKWTPQRSC